MGKDKLRIDKDDRREDRVLRKGLKVDTNNTIPERRSKPTSISTDMNNAHHQSLMDLPKCPLRIYNKNDQGSFDKVSSFRHFPLYYQTGLTSTQNSMVLRSAPCSSRKLHNVLLLSRVPFSN
jgi:hypothetical protein